VSSYSHSSASYVHDVEPDKQTTNYTTVAHLCRNSHFQQSNPNSSTPTNEDAMKVSPDMLVNTKNNVVKYQSERVKFKATRAAGPLPRVVR
jgi:hypothetical protein